MNNPVIKGREKICWRILMMLGNRFKSSCQVFRFRMIYNIHNHAIRVYALVLAWRLEINHQTADSSDPSFVHFCRAQGPEQIHVSKFYKESKDGKFVNYITDDATTLYETFRKGAHESNNGPCLGWRDSLTTPYMVCIKEAVLSSRKLKYLTNASIHATLHSGWTSTRRCCAPKISALAWWPSAFSRTSWLAFTRRTDPNGYSSSRAPTVFRWWLCRCTIPSDRMRAPSSSDKRTCARWSWRTIRRPTSCWTRDHAVWSVWSRSKRCARRPYSGPAIVASKFMRSWM